MKCSKFKDPTFFEYGIELLPIISLILCYLGKIYQGQAKVHFSAFSPHAFLLRQAKNKHGKIQLRSFENEFNIM